LEIVEKDLNPQIISVMELDESSSFQVGAEANYSSTKDLNWKLLSCPVSVRMGHFPDSGHLEALQCSGNCREGCTSGASSMLVKVLGLQYRK